MEGVKCSPRLCMLNIDEKKSPLDILYKMLL